MDFVGFDIKIFQYNISGFIRILYPEQLYRYFVLGKHNKI